VCRWWQASGAALVLICVLLSRGAPFGVLLAAFALMGLFTLPILPGVIENAVEVTYPIPEEASSGLLFCSGNLVGVAFTVLLSKLVSAHDVDTAAFWTPAAVFLLASIAACVALVLPYAGDYKRLAAEQQGIGAGSGSGSSGGGSGTSAGLLASPLLHVGYDDDQQGWLAAVATSPRSPQRSSPTDDSVHSLVV
jgi:hypothetical protein